MLIALLSQDTVAASVRIVWCVCVNGGLGGGRGREGRGEGLTVNLKFMSNLRVRFGQIHTDSLVSLYVRFFG